MSYGESPQVRPNKTPLIYTGADFIKTWDKTDEFIKELSGLYNKYGIDSKLNMRDFLLAEMSYNFLAVMHNTMRIENEMRDNTNEGQALLYAVEKTAKRTKKEMIEKAGEWFEKYLFDIGYPDDWCRDSPNLISGKDRFIKAMQNESK